MKKGLCLFVFVSALALILATSQTSSPSSSTNPSPSKPPNPVGSAQTPSAGPQIGSGSQGTAAGEDPQTQIQRALTNDPVVGHDNIMVSVSGNDIDLTGDVGSKKEKETANKIANKYAGSLRVKDHLKVRPQPGSSTGPIAPGTTLPHNNFLSDQNSSSASGQAGSGTSGGGVAGQTTGNGSSNSSAKPKGTTETPAEQSASPENAVPSSQLQPQIQNALKNEPTLANDNINVTVSDDEINLAGSVATAKEKLTAKRIVQSFAGNRKVKDQLTLAGRNSQ